MSRLAMELLFEAFGVPVMVGVEDPDLVPAVRATLPPGWKALETGQPRERVVLRGGRGGEYQLVVADELSGLAATPGLAVQLLDGQVRLAVAAYAPEHVFIHAGVVAFGRQMLVLPGRSFTGKSTLVEALLRAGGTYYSDEYAVLGRDGRVQPYVKPLSRRPPGSGRERREVEKVDPRSLGVGIGSVPLQISLIACARYRSGAHWAPRRLGPGESALALLDHAVAARVDPERVLPQIGRAVNGCPALEGERGEADETAALLIRALTGER